MSEERPRHRRRSVGVKVDEETYRAAKERAASEGRSLIDVIRSFLFFWSQHELPGDFTPPRSPGEGRRARKGGDD